MTTQLEFTTRAGGCSQCDLILERLRQTPGQWVSMIELVQCSGSYNVHSRISELRGRGLTIEQHQTWEGGKCHSVYRIVDPEVLNRRGAEAQR